MNSMMYLIGVCSADGATFPKTTLGHTNSHLFWWRHHRNGFSGEEQFDRGPWIPFQPRTGLSPRSIRCSPTQRAPCSADLDPDRCPESELMHRIERTLLKRKENSKLSRQKLPNIFKSVKIMSNVVVSTRKFFWFDLASVWPVWVIFQFLGSKFSCKSRPNLFGLFGPFW